MELTNQQIEDAVQALRVFNPKVETKCKLRLSRNLRKLTSAWKEKEFDRVSLLWMNVTDQTKRPENEERLALTPTEQLKYNKEYRELMKKTQEVEIHPIRLYDGEGGGTGDDHDIDISKVAIPNEILGVLEEAGVFVLE